MAVTLHNRLNSFNANSRISGWRPINIVPAISKITEKTMMTQMMTHLKENQLISSNHHGSMPGRLTQTLILKLHHKLVQCLNHDDEEAAFILLDQSKAYNLVPHKILIDKLSILNYSQKSLTTLRNYLSEHHQYVQIQSKESDILSVRPKLVTQGSTLSCHSST